MNTRRRKSSHRRHFGRNSYRGGIPDTDCAICLEHMSDNDVCTTKCNHKYHLHCLLRWFDSQNNKNRTCPFCRTNIQIQPTEPVQSTQPMQPMQPSERRSTRDDLAGRGRDRENRMREMRQVRESQRLTRRREIDDREEMGRETDHRNM